MDAQYGGDVDAWDDDEIAHGTSQQQHHNSPFMGEQQTVAQRRLFDDKQSEQDINQQDLDTIDSVPPLNTVQQPLTNMGSSDVQAASTTAPVCV